MESTPTSVPGLQEAARRPSLETKEGNLTNEGIVCVCCGERLDVQAGVAACPREQETMPNSTHGAEAPSPFARSGSRATDVMRRRGSMSPGVGYYRLLNTSRSARPRNDTVAEVCSRQIALEIHAGKQ